MLRDWESGNQFDNFFVPKGTVENSPAIHRRVGMGVLPRPGGTLESATDSSVPPGRGSRAAFPGSQLPGYFQTVPTGTKTGQAQRCFFRCVTSVGNCQLIIQRERAATLAPALGTFNVNSD